MLIKKTEDGLSIRNFAIFSGELLCENGSPMVRQIYVFGARHSKRILCNIE